MDTNLLFFLLLAEENENGHWGRRRRWGWRRWWWWRVSVELHAHHVNLSELTFFHPSKKTFWFQLCCDMFGLFLRKFFQRYLICLRCSDCKDESVSYRTFSDFRQTKVSLHVEFTVLLGNEPDSAHLDASWHASVQQTRVLSFISLILMICQWNFNAIWFMLNTLSQLFGSGCITIWQFDTECDWKIQVLHLALPLWW